MIDGIGNLAGADVNRAVIELTVPVAIDAAVDDAKVGTSLPRDDTGNVPAADPTVAFGEWQVVDETTHHAMFDVVSPPDRSPVSHSSYPLDRQRRRHS